jgi:hypothetical protein
MAASSISRPRRRDDDRHLSGVSTIEPVHLVDSKPEGAEARRAADDEA